MHINFNPGRGGWHIDDTQTVDLKSNEVIGFIPAPVKIGAQCGIHQVEQITEDAVLIDVGDLIEGRNKLQTKRWKGFFFALKGIAPACIRLEAALEILAEQLHDFRVAKQSLMEAQPSKPAAKLEVIVAIGPEQVDLPPVESGEENQSIQSIVFSLPS